MAWKLTWKNPFTGEEIVACERHVTNNVNAMLEMYPSTPPKELRPDLYTDGYPNEKGVWWDLYYELIKD